MTTTYAYTSTLVIVECANCHQDFGMLPNLNRDRRDDHRTFYCPSGHKNYFPGKSDTEKLRAKLEDAQAAVIRTQARLDQARADAAFQKRRAAALKGAATRARNRMAKGVCPVKGCHRHFPNVQDHVRTCHPDYDLHEIEST